MKQTSHKAIVAGGSTAVAVLAALLGFGEMPADDQITNAFIGLGTAAATGIASAFLTWAKANLPKDE